MKLRNENQIQCLFLLVKESITTRLSHRSCYKMKLENPIADNQNPFPFVTV